MLHIGADGLLTSNRKSEAIALDFCNFWKAYKRSTAVMATNIYLPNWFEADVCCVRDSGMVDEFEIKISRGDFFADAKKKGFGARGVNKHERLRAGIEQHNLASFWYITPKGLISLNELPSFAGLIEVIELPRKQLRERLTLRALSGRATFQVTHPAPRLRTKSDEASLFTRDAVFKTLSYRYTDLLLSGKTLKQPKYLYDDEASS